MFWKRKESKLQLGEPQDKIWNHQIVKSSFVSAHSQDIIAYTGWAYVLEGKQQGGVFSGRATCNTLQHALFDLDVAVSESARVTVSCNGERVWSGLVEVAADSSSPTLHHLSTDITQQKETKAVSDIDVEFVFANRPGSIWVLADDDSQWVPKIQQVPSWPYAMWSILFFAAAWGGLIGLLMVGISVSGTIDDPRLSTLIAVLGPLVGYVGLRDLAKLPLGEALRRLYAWTRSRSSPFAMTVLVLMSASFVSAALFILDVSLKQYDYSNLINDYLNDDEHDPEILRKAFIREPWRREAQVLFEQAAFSMRAADRGEIREYVHIFTDNDMVRLAVREAGEAGPESPFYLGSERRAISDPVRWFASMLPEGDKEDEWDRTDLAIELLETRSTCGAKLHKLMLSIERVQKEEEFLNLLNQLKKSRKEISNCGFHEYPRQIALDMLATVSIVSDFDDAVMYFNKLLRMRSSTPETEQTYWRVPDKLMLYALFRSYFDTTISDSDASDPVVARAGPIRKFEIDGVAFGSVFETDVYNADVNEKFRSREGWEEGTLVNLDKAWISETLNIGWRF